MCNLRIIEGQQYQPDDGGRWATVTSALLAANDVGWKSWSLPHCEVTGGLSASSDTSEDLMYENLGMFTTTEPTLQAPTIR